MMLTSDKCLVRSVTVVYKITYQSIDAWFVNRQEMKHLFFWEGGRDGGQGST